MGIANIPAVSDLYSRIAIVTTTSTWTHPDGVSATNPKPVRAIIIGGGGGGGSGSATGTTTNGVNGGGGGGGSGVVAVFNGHVTAGVSITIGAGGSGGAGVVSTSATTTAGNSGTSGGNTSFGNITAYGGQGGQGAPASSNTVIGGGSGGSAGGGSHSDPSADKVSPGASYGWHTGSNAISSFLDKNYPLINVWSSSQSDNPPAYSRIGDAPRSNTQTSSGRLVSWGQLTHITYATTDSVTMHHTDFAGIGALIPGGGGSGGACTTIAVNSGTTAGVGIFGSGGTGSNVARTTDSANVTSSAGGAGTGYGGGGGGSGAAQVRNAIAATATTGAGGAGAAGAVIIYY